MLVKYKRDELQKIDAYPQKNNYARIGIATSVGVIILQNKEILHCRAEGNYCSIKTSTGKEVLVYKTLKVVEDMLPKDPFCRIHASHLIQLNGICKINSNSVLLINGERLPVSRNRHSELMHCLQKMVRII